MVIYLIYPFVGLVTDPPACTPEMSDFAAIRLQHQEETRARLLEAAARVFARRGYHGAKLEEVAREAGHTTGAVYSNFAGKEELFLALADVEVTRRVAEIESVLDEPEGSGDVSGEAAAQFQAFIEREPEWPLLFYEFWSYGVRNPRLRDEFEARRRAVRGAIERVLQETAKRRGLQFRYPVEQLAVALGAVINGMAFERAADPDAVPEVLVQFVVGALLGAAIRSDAS